MNKNINRRFVRAAVSLSAAAGVFTAAQGGVPLNNLQGTGGIAFNPLAYTAGRPWDGAGGGDATNAVWLSELNGIVSRPQVGAWYVNLNDADINWYAGSAALTLADPAILARVEPIVRQVAAASEKGLNEDGSMTHEANLDTGDVDADRHWWVQAEAVVGFLNLYQHFGERRSLQQALRTWHYIRTHLIDYEGGEWWWSCDPEGRINRTDDKAGFWKCPYHNSRLCLEILERFPIVH